MLRKSYLTLVAAVTLLLLTVAPVYAAPSLNLGSTASYNMTGKVQVDQSCTADPVAYAGQACLGFFSTEFTFVSIHDDSRCSPIGDPVCTFSPTIVYCALGSSVEWENNGNLSHTVTSNATLNGGLPSFDSGPLPPGGFFSHTFDQTGTYYYSDVNYSWMKGTVVVSAPLPSPILPPKLTSNLVDLSGAVGWNVEGLSSDQVNLNVSHQISILVPSPVPGISFIPVTESGNFEQSINLSTRVESPSTAASLVKSSVESLLPAIAGATLSTGAIGSVFQTMLLAQSNSPDYTIWWVNGPLSNGSPVQILHGWSSVTGSESLNLGTAIGTRSAWIVTSQLSQTIDMNMPNPNYSGSISTSTATASLKLLWSYDKSADLLLRNNSTISLTVQNVASTTIQVQVPCGTSICLSSVPVTVTRNMALTINLALRLSSTNLKQLSASPSEASTLMSLLSALPWVPLGIAGLAAVVAASLILWFTRRTKGQTMPAPAPTTSPAPPPTTPS